MSDYIREYIQSTQQSFARLDTCAPSITEAANLIAKAVLSGRRVYLCGNGGSAADAQHIAAEFVGRFQKERRPLPALALTTDTSALTAIANDYAYDDVFARQLAAFGQENDVLIAISTSGNSANVIKACDIAKELGMKVVTLTGAGGGALASVANVAIHVPSDKTSHIQEMHIAVGHMLCGFTEDSL